MIDLSKITYRLVVTDENGTQYDIKDYVENLGWEENENELSVRSSFTVKNDNTSRGKLSSLIKPGCLICIFASDGRSFEEEVARGFVETWNPQSKNRGDTLQCTCYDMLYQLQKSQENRYYPSGTGTQSIITGLLQDYEIPTKAYHGPNVTHGKLKYSSSYVSDILRDVLEDATKKEAGNYLLQGKNGSVEVVKRGSNPIVYVFQEDTIESISVSMSMGDLVTRVRVIGQAEDEDNSRIEATLNGLTKYGIRQRIYRRGSDESLADAQSAAQEILKEQGTVKQEITLSSPDVPFLRKGDLVYVMTEVSHDYYFIKGIRHDCDSYQMTMELEIAKPETISTENQTETKKEYKEGDLVNFHGGRYYVSSYADSKGYMGAAGKAKITKRNIGQAHPWHLIHADKNSRVYGWVDEGSFD